MNKTFSVGSPDWLLLSIRPDSIDDSIRWNYEQSVSQSRTTWHVTKGHWGKMLQILSICHDVSPGYSLALYCNPAVTLPIMLCWLIRIDRDPIFDWQISLQLISVRICILHHIGYSVATLCIQKMWQTAHNTQKLAFPHPNCQVLRGICKHGLQN